MSDIREENAVCFAHDKTSEFNDSYEKWSSTETCYALTYEAYGEMKKYGRCGTEKCPFYKLRREDVRLD